MPFHRGSAARRGAPLIGYSYVNGLWGLDKRFITACGPLQPKPGSCSEVSSKEDFYLGLCPKVLLSINSFNQSVKIFCFFIDHLYKLYNKI